MRVNVIHPKYLADQHLVAEYREIKMGPKALSKSLYSKNGVDKNRISGDSWVCWNCCKKIPTDIQKMRYY